MRWTSEIRYTAVIAIANILPQLTTASTTYERDVSISVQEGIIRHFDHITDLPSSPWYRVPQKGEDYKTFQDKEYTNAKNCNQDLENVVYEIDTSGTPTPGKNLYDAMSPWKFTDPVPLNVSDLSWPQMDGFLVRNVYPTYMGIFGGPRQFCFLRRYMAKTWWGIPDVPRDREWGPYRCTGRQIQDSNNVQTPYDKGYTKVIALRSGPERKYKPILNLVDIRAQTDWFGDMYTHLELDRDTNSPMGKWQNNRPITNYTRNEIMEKYNVLGFYNVEHEIFNDNSRFRLVARETMLVNEHQGQMWEVDTMLPTYHIITGGPYKSNLWRDRADEQGWMRRNMVPNHVTRSHKSGFMRTSVQMGHMNYPSYVMFDYPSNNRPCCTNSAGGYETYNIADLRLKGVSFMYTPSFAPFFLGLTSSTCTVTGATNCTETYEPWRRNGNWGKLSAMGQRHFNVYVQIYADRQWGEESDYIPGKRPAGNVKDLKNALTTSAQTDFEINDNVIPQEIELQFYDRLYAGLLDDLIANEEGEKKWRIGDSTDQEVTDHYGKDIWTYNDGIWNLNMHMFGEPSGVIKRDDNTQACDAGAAKGTKVSVNYECSADQYARNLQEKIDYAPFISEFPDYADAWKHVPYKRFVKKVSGFASEIFENDPRFSDFVHFVPRFQSVDCNRKALDENENARRNAVKYINENFKDSPMMGTSYAGEKTWRTDTACDFEIIASRSVEEAYAPNQYYHMDQHTGNMLQHKHTISDIKIGAGGTCADIEITVEVDCGKPSDSTTGNKDTLEDNFWAYQKRCSKDTWDKVYDIMFPAKVSETTFNNFRDEFNKDKEI